MSCSPNSVRPLGDMASVEIWDFSVRSVSVLCTREICWMLSLDEAGGRWDKKSGTNVDLLVCIEAECLGLKVIVSGKSSLHGTEKNRRARQSSESGGTLD